MKFSSFAVATVLLVLAAHTYATDAAAFGEVSIIGRFKQEPIASSQYSIPMIITTSLL